MYCKHVHFRRPHMGICVVQQKAKCIRLWYRHSLVILCLHSVSHNRKGCTHHCNGLGSQKTVDAKENRDS